MRNLFEIWRKVIFNMSWVFMPPEKRYAYLWNRSKSIRSEKHV